MPLYVPGRPDVGVERLGPANAEELVDFLAAGWQGWYNDTLHADMDFSGIMVPGEPKHIQRAEARLADPHHVHWGARDTGTNRLVSLAWFKVNSTSEVVLEEWLTAPEGYREQGIGAAALAAAVRDDVVARKLAAADAKLTLEVYQRSPIIPFYNLVWGLEDTGVKRAYPHVGSGVPQRLLSGSPQGLWSWLRSKPRLHSGIAGQ
jgi:hypothetical protein